MKPIYIDTSALYALADNEDFHHRKAAAFYRQSNHGFLMGNFVFAEILSLLTKRVGKPAAVRFGKALREGPRFHIQALDSGLEETAWTWFSSKYQDKEFDLIDCSSFVLMESLKIRQAFSFDRHFRQAGFQALPAA